MKLADIERYYVENHGMTEDQFYDTALKECPACDGSGECPDCGDGWFDEEEECVSCNDSCNCQACEGSGKVEP